MGYFGNFIGIFKTDRSYELLACQVRTAQIQLGEI